MLRNKRFFAIIMALLICFSLLSACSFMKSDEELIKSRIESFIEAYNSGDFDGVLDCLDSKTRNTYKAALKIGGALIGEAGFGISLSDLFSISVGLISDDDILTISNASITIDSETEATVNATLGYKDMYEDSQEEVFFTLKKEGNDWFIKNLESR